MISGNVLWHPDRQTSWARSAWGQQRAGSGRRRSKCHGSPSWTVHPHLQGNIKISNICTKMLSPVVLTVALAVQKWLNSRLIAVRTGGRGARGESETSKQKKTLWTQRNFSLLLPLWFHDTAMWESNLTFLCSSLNLRWTFPTHTRIGALNTMAKIPKRALTA